MYGIIHKEIFDSTVMAEGYEVVYVFMSMIAIADDQDCVRLTPSTLALRINMPQEKTEGAIERLGRPDADSESKDFGGRRIVPISEIFPEHGRGWFMVNREKYIEKAKKEHRRTYMRELMREKRKNDNNRPEQVNNEGILSDSKQQLAHININKDINKDINKKAWDEFVQHRKDIKQPLSDLSISKNMKILSGHTHDEQQKMVDLTIANRWRGLFPLKDHPKGQSNGKYTTGAIGRAMQAFEDDAKREKEAENVIPGQSALPSH